MRKVSASFIFAASVSLLLLDAAFSESEKKILFYRDPMGKNITSPVPKQDEMGMDYIPVYEEDPESQDTKAPEGRAPVRVSDTLKQQIGVTTAAINREHLVDTIHASGRVAFDPKIFEAIENYRTASELGDTAMRKAAAVRLKLMGLSEKEIANAGTGKQESSQFLLPSGAVWVYADIYEFEAGRVHVGQTIRGSSPFLPGKTFTGKISGINPTINPTSRTIQIKAEMHDEQTLLKPDMYLSIEIEIDLGEQLTAPSSAIVHQDDQNLVYVETAEGFSPRAVTVGDKLKDKVVIKSGLSEGERLVTSANFLIDSESRVQGVIREAAGDIKSH